MVALVAVHVLLVPLLLSQVYHHVLIVLLVNTLVHQVHLNVLLVLQVHLIMLLVLLYVIYALLVHHNHYPLLLLVMHALLERQMLHVDNHHVQIVKLDSMQISLDYKHVYNVNPVVYNH